MVTNVNHECEFDKEDYYKNPQQYTPIFHSK
jgi:hypothetical protein